MTDHPLYAAWGWRAGEAFNTVNLLGLWHSREMAETVVARWEAVHGTHEDTMVTPVVVGQTGWPEGFVPSVGPPHEANLPLLQGFELNDQILRSAPAVVFLNLCPSHTSAAVYYLWHEYLSTPEVWGIFFIGVYAAPADAIEAAVQLTSQPGFQSYPHGFRCLRVEPDQDHSDAPLIEWDEGA